MQWHVPAKTFLVGEYVALLGGPALLISTKPCFTMTLEGKALIGIHPDSPAGKYWLSSGFDAGLIWQDPYDHCGGLGASSAQFLSAYLASCFLKKTRPCLEELRHVYWQNAFSGEGFRPSGYDLLAQTQQGCVYIAPSLRKIELFSWPFADLAFLLVHSGKKLNTHHHLQQVRLLPDSTAALIDIVEKTKQAFQQVSSGLLIEAVRAYHEKLTALNLVATHTLEQLDILQKKPSILAAKGCGAMGADVLLLIFPQEKMAEQVSLLKREDWKILATSSDLHTDFPLIVKNIFRT